MYTLYINSRYNWTTELASAVVHVQNPTELVNIFFGQKRYFKMKRLTSYRSCHVLRAITLNSNNGSNFGTVINLRHDNGLYVRIATTFRIGNLVHCGKAFFTNANYNLALALLFRTRRPKLLMSSL
jgi:hypothetical protein